MSSASETTSWTICPVCDKPNPAGTQFCKHCWGAIIHADSPVFSAREAEREIARRLFRQRRNQAIKAITIGLASLLIVFLGLYYFTDIIFKPPQGVNSNSLPEEWAMFRHDLSHSGNTGSSDILPQGMPKWVFATGSAIHSSPAVADGTIYVGSRDGKLYALDAATGDKRWEYQTGSWVESSPAIANGVVYFGSNDGRLYALNTLSGEKLWDFKTKYPIMSSPAVANGIVYFGAYDYYVYALDAVTGTKLWEFKTDSPVASSPTIANGIVYIGSGDYLYALHATSGRFRLRFKAYYPVLSSPVVNNETVYFSNSKGVLFAINGKARNWPREHETRPYWLQLYIIKFPPVPPPPPQSGSLWALRLGTTGTSSPIIASDTLYIGSGNKLVAVDLQNRQKRWEFEAKATITSSPALVDTTIYAGSEDGRLYAVDAATGEKLWDILTGGEIASSPAVANGTVYLGSHDGNLYAIR